MRLSVLPWVAGAISLFTAGVQARSHEPNAIRHVSTLDQPTIKAPSATNRDRVDHLSHFDITFTIRDKEQRIKLELEPNHEILADDAFVQYLDSDGKVHTEEPISRHRHKAFKGRTLVGRKVKGMWDPVGWARIYIRRDGPKPLFEGVFNINGDNHHIELQSTYLRKQRPQDVDIPRQEDEYMVFYRDSQTTRLIDTSSHTDLKRSLSEGGSTCQADKLGFPFDSDYTGRHSYAARGATWASMPIHELFGLSKRQADSGSAGTGVGFNLASSIGDTTGCPSTKLVALVGIATDCSFWEKFEDADAAQESVVTMVNSASAVYEKSFNISIGLRNLTITDRTCTQSSSSGAPWNMPCSQGNLSQRLDLFSEWRGQRADDNAYWTLMTTCNSGAEVGLAWINGLCQSGVTQIQSGRAMSGANVVVTTGGSGWQVFAHETGHTFGAVHDCTAETCNQGLEDDNACCPMSGNTCDAGGDYIMNPSTGPDITEFSQCSIGNICGGIARQIVNTNCLSENRGIVTFTGAQCGNGIVEAGEDCDCGGQDGCAGNQCCDASTCKFRDGAVCDDANDGCCHSCQFASAGTVCRSSTGECDIEETCTGNSSTCPTDHYKDDGESCGGDDSGLKCASGQCTSRDAQCQSVSSNSNARACDDGGCRVTCEVASSMFAQQCIQYPPSYLDGTPCGHGGTCRNGACEDGSWIDNHKDIIIPVVAAVGGLIILAILISIFRRCRRPRNTMKPMPPVGYGYGGYGPWNNGQMPPPQPTPLRRLSRAMRPGHGPPPPQGPYPGPPQYGPPPPQGPGPMPSPYPGYPGPTHDHDGPPPGYMQTMRYA
ncbi:Metallo-peptidase family M12-domain-containing protein [Aspergillus egyptiacus]|nr:Metallo-peptidase family M12-domain-containing protein [Aspergillus egyptiacus]